jgi:DNA-binding PadR family transcriptional regulator
VIVLTSQDVILGILMKKSQTGYDIKNLLESVFSYFYNASFGTIYPTLAKMEKEGFISKESIVQDGKPNKNVFTITAKGRERFNEYLHSGIQATELKSDFMVRLFFGELAEPAIYKEWLKQGIRAMEEELAKLKADKAKWEQNMSPTQKVCIQIGIDNTEAVKNSMIRGLEQLSRQ